MMPLSGQGWGWGRPEQVLGSFQGKIREGSLEERAPQWDVKRPLCLVVERIKLCNQQIHLQLLTFQLCASWQVMSPF